MSVRSLVWCQAQSTQVPKYLLKWPLRSGHRALLQESGAPDGTISAALLKYQPPYSIFVVAVDLTAICVHVFHVRVLAQSS